MVPTVICKKIYKKSSQNNAQFTVSDVAGTTSSSVSYYYSNVLLKTWAMVLNVEIMPLPPTNNSVYASFTDVFIRNRGCSMTVSM